MEDETGATPIYDETAAAEAQPEPTPVPDNEETAAETISDEPSSETHDQYVMSTLVHNDVNAEDHIGDAIEDPWKDPAQTDWPMADDLQIGDDDDE